MVPNKNKEEKSLKKQKIVDSNSSVVESSDKSLIERGSVKKYCMLHEKCNYSTDNYKYLEALIGKHKQKRRNILARMHRARND